MSVYKKLNEARIKLQTTKLNKSGHNKFAGYQYFELGDFLPTINSIFNEVGLCGVVSFDKEIASLLIVDIEDNTQVVITSPMGGANLKGCHEVQNIGAVETYQRRYLWVTALEIVEHDALEAVTGSEKTNHSNGKGDLMQAQLPNISDDRLNSAIDKIIAGEYTAGKLKSSFTLTQKQLEVLASKVGAK